MRRRWPVLLALVVVGPVALVLALRMGVRYVLGGPGAEVPAPDQAARERILGAAAGRWQRAAASFLLAGRATFSLGDDEASALLTERLAGTRLARWEVRGVKVQFEPGMVRGALALASPPGLAGFLLGGRTVPVRLTILPRLAGEAVEARLAEVRVGRLGVSPERVLALLAEGVALPPGVAVDTRRGIVLVVPADLVAGAAVAVEGLEIAPGGLRVTVRAASG